MGVTVIRTYECDTCGKSLEEDQVMLAGLPRAPGDPKWMQYAGMALDVVCERVYVCSYDCLRAKVEEFAARA